MKKFIVNLQKDRVVFLFVIIGLILIIFPKNISTVIPYVLGISSILYAIANIIVSLRFPASDAKLGDGIIKAITGGVIIFLKADAISILGVIWAVQSLHDVAEEIEEYRESKEFSIVSCISMGISILLAVMLMIDPFEHFATHVRILGLEIISSAFIRRKRFVKMPEQTGNTVQNETL